MDSDGRIACKPRQRLYYDLQLSIIMSDIKETEEYVVLSKILEEWPAFAELNGKRVGAGGWLPRFVPVQPELEYC